MKRHLSLIQPEPSEQQIQTALQWLVDDEMDRFAAHLETARVIWRKFPQLVETPEFPEPFRTIVVEQDKKLGYKGLCPNDTNWQGYVAIDPTAPNLSTALLPKAREIAMAWAQNQERRRGVPA